MSSCAVSGTEAILAFVFSILIVLIILIVAAIIMQHLGRSFFDIIRDDEWRPSLSQFQFMMWTSVVGVLFLGIYFIRAFGGVVAFPPSIPTNILYLMGISVAVPVVSGGISAVKFCSAPKKKPSPPKKFYTMLEENGKPSLSRLQMFIWTWIGIIIYLVLFWVMITNPTTLQSVDKLSLPDIDPTLVALMGLSQGAFLGAKAVGSMTPDVTDIKPGAQKAGLPISLLGSYFGDYDAKLDSIFFDDIRADNSCIVNWTSTRIDLNLPKNLTVGDHLIKVAVGSSMSDEIKYSVLSNGGQPTTITAPGQAVKPNYCHKCGSPLKSDAKFCSVCGESL